MNQRFIGGHIYSKYDRATNTFSGFLRKIKTPIELNVTLLYKWEAPGGGMNSAWEWVVDSTDTFYIAAGTPAGGGPDQSESSEQGGLFQGPGWNLDFGCLNQDEPILERIWCLIKKAWKFILVIVGLLLLLKKRKK